MLADLVHSKRALTDPSQSVLNRLQETNVALMHPDVQLCFSVGVRLIGQIPCRTAGSHSRWYKNSRSGQGLKAVFSQVDLQVPER
jgi:hypothetical protein